MKPIRQYVMAIRFTKKTISKITSPILFTALLQPHSNPPSSLYSSLHPSTRSSSKFLSLIIIRLHSSLSTPLSIHSRFSLYLLCLRLFSTSPFSFQFHLSWIMPTRHRLSLIALVSLQFPPISLSPFIIFVSLASASLLARPFFILAGSETMNQFRKSESHYTCHSTRGCMCVCMLRVKHSTRREKIACERCTRITSADAAWKLMRGEPMESALGWRERRTIERIIYEG